MKPFFKSSIPVAFLLLGAIQSPAKVKIEMSGDSIAKMDNTNSNNVSFTKYLHSFCE